MLAAVSLLIANTALILLAMLRSPTDHAGNRQLMSAYSVTLMLFAIYVAVSGWLVVANGGKYTWAPTYEASDGLVKALALSAVALIIFLLSYAANSSIAARASTSDPQVDNTGSDGVVLAWLLVVAGLLLKLYLVRSSGGIDASAFRLSGGVRLSTGTDSIGTGQNAVRTLSGIADAGASWLVVQALRRRTRLTLPVLVLIAVLGLSFFTIGKRLALLLPVLIVLVAYSRFRKPLRAGYAPFVVLAMLGVGMITLLVRVFLPARTAGVQIDLSQIPYAQGSIFSFYFYSLEYSTEEMITVVVQNSQELHSLLGPPLKAFYITNIQPFSYVVPRQLWPGKPTAFLDVSYGISSVLTGAPIDQVTAGYASTIIGASWVFGGLLGTLVFLVAFGAWTSAIDRWATRQTAWTTKRVFVYGIMLNLTFHWFRQGTIGWAFIVGVVQQLGFLLGVVLLTAATWRSARALEDARPALTGAAP